MALEAILTADEYGGLDEGQRGLYRQFSKDDLKAHNLEGDHYVLDVAPKAGWNLEPVGGLKSTLSQKKSEIETLKEQLAAYNDDDGTPLDPASAREALKKAVEMRDWSPDQKSKEWAENEVSAVKKKYSEEVAKLQERLDKELATSNAEAVRNAINSALMKNGVDKESAPIVFDHFASRAIAERQDGRIAVFARDENGGKAITQKPGQDTYRTIDEEVEIFKNSRSGAKFFNPESNNRGSGNSGAIDGKAPVNTANMSPSQKIAAGFGGGK